MNKVVMKATLSRTNGIEYNGNEITVPVFNVINKSYMLYNEDELTEPLSPSKFIPIQPVRMDKEFLSRFAEVAVRFLFTDIVIVPDGVMLNDK
jgi:hypothetical protein